MRGGLLLLSLLACAALAACEAGSAPQKGGECATCHMPEYQSATTPLHVGTKPTTCGVCHSQDGWHPNATPIHHEWWPLTGKHPNAECSWCHKGSPTTMKGPSKDCVSCHKPEYDESPYPGHQTFPTKCAECHTTNAFKPATQYPPAPKSNTVSAAAGGKLVPLKGVPNVAPVTTRGGSSSGSIASSGGGPVSPTPVSPTPVSPTPTARPDVTSRSSPRRR